MFLSGIDIGGTSIKFGIFDEQLNLLQQWSRPTPKEPAEAAALIAAQLEPYHVAAIGAGAPGTLNAARETITADNLAWVDVPLAALLRRASGLPAVVINDGHAAMLAEMRSGALQNVQTGILLTLGTGIGGGIVINGQCWRSPTGLAPELGHIITHSDGLPCPCGQCGCFEQYASATALIRMAGGESPADLIARARSGNAAAQAVFAQYGRIDVLCNNAGVSSRTPLVDYTLEEFNKVMSINVTAVFVCTQAAARIGAAAVLLPRPQCQGDRHRHRMRRRGAPHRD